MLTEKTSHALKCHQIISSNCDSYHKAPMAALDPLLSNKVIQLVRTEALLQIARIEWTTIEQSLGGRWVFRNRPDDQPSRRPVPSVNRHLRVQSR